MYVSNKNIFFFRYISLAWDEQNVRSQDYLNVLQYISENPSGIDLVWDEVRNRWTELVDRFTINSRYLGNVIPGISSSFSTQDKLKEVIVTRFLTFLIIDLLSY